MKLNRNKRAVRLLCIVLAPVFLTGCPGLVGTGTTTDDNSGGFDGGGSGERPLTDVCFPAGAGGGEAPTGELVFPIDGATITSTPASFLFRGSDPDGDPLAITVFVSDQANVFETSPIAELSCATAEGLEELLEINVPNPASFFWGIEISDGLNTIQRPADGVGVPFSTVPSSSFRSGLDGVALICPRQGLPARAVTTFQWSLGGFVPTRAQIFVGRANQTSPFDSPLRIFEVVPQSATSLAIPPSEALPLGEPLTWGLRVEAANGVAFTLGGSAGETFTPRANVPPSGSLLSPPNDSVLTDATESFLLAWEVDAGNCEDEATSTVFMEPLGSNSAPVAIFDSPIQLQVDPDSQETNIVSSLAALSFDAGVWAWAVRTTDGTDQTDLQDSDDAARSFRTFFRDTSPRFVTPPIVETSDCGVGEVDTIAFSYTDDNGLDTVSVNVSFSITEASVFEAPSATLPVEDGQGSTRIALAGSDTTACPLFASGRGFYGVELQDGANPAVRATVFYPGPPPPPPPPPPLPRGACCDLDGFCTDDVAQGDCVGEYDKFGADISCDSGDSAVPWCTAMLGACCENGECYTSDRLSCEEGFDATWFIGADCDDTGNFTCPAPILGACCSDGFCNGFTGEEYCAGEIGGEWFVDEDCSGVTPPGSGDAGFSCPIQLGACCTSGSCAGTMNENLCLEEYQGQWYQDENCIGEPGFGCPLPACTWDNGPWNGDGSGRGLSPPDFLQRRAVNELFFFSDCTIDRLTVQVVEDNGWQPGDSITVFVYRSVKGQPVSTPAYEVTVPLTTRTLIGEDFDARGVYEYVVENLGLDVAADTTYWIGFRNDAGSGEGSNYWLPSSGGNNFGGGGSNWISEDDGATWSSDFIQFSFTIG